MIPVARVPEPEGFDERVRKRGAQWLKDNPSAERPRDYWSEFRPALRDGFRWRCGYTAMWDGSGTLDHFLSWRGHEHLAYEWSNYRYVSLWINSSKKTTQILDPYEVGEGWFEILLPSLQLVMTDKVPESYRARAEATLGALPLVHDDRIVQLRSEWYEMYKRSELSLAGLCKVAPLLAMAVEKHLSAGLPLP